MKKTIVLLGMAMLAAAAARAERPTAEVKPQEHYGAVARRLVAMLERHHVLQSRFDDSMSRRAWTNLVTRYDPAHMIFLKSDIDRFAVMETRIDDQLRQGDVSFGYEIFRTFSERLAERTEFVTNLLATTEFDFSRKEEYQWSRKDAPWPETAEERDRLWTLRIKNELLSQTLSRELDEEQAKMDEFRDKKKSTTASTASKDPKDPNTSKAPTASTASKDPKDPKDAKEEEAAEPKLTPKENMIKRYRHYYTVATEPDEENVLQNYLSAAAGAYDPHSDYMSPTRKEDFDMDMNLSLCGVGAVLSFDPDDGTLKIQEVMPGGPMDKDGRIKKGDRISGVGQGTQPVEDTTWKPMKKTIHKIRGRKGTKVVLEIIPAKDTSGATRKRIGLVRDEIKLDEGHAATGRVETVVMEGVTNLLGYARLPGFYGTMDKRPNDPEYRSCSLDVAKYVAQFNRRGTKGMILDLRGNGGGSLKEAVLLSQLFLQQGGMPVVQIREVRSIGVLPTFPDLPSFAYRKPLVVLIDRLSASASEIVAAVLQDCGRAIVIGDTQSHGKGTVQTVYPMGAERFGSMKLTTARFYRINGSSTQVRGVASDIVLPSTLDGLDTGEDKLPNALPWSRVEPAEYGASWNLGSYLPTLKERSERRLKTSEEWKRHLRAVQLFRESSERKSAPLERTARLKLMREERKMRELDDAEALDDDESPEETAFAQSEDGKDRKNDVVLDEAFKILADLVNLTGGREAPPPQTAEMPAWLRALGGD